MTTEEIRQLEQEWLKRHKELRDLQDEYGWEPYPLEHFDALLVIAWSRNLGPFLDVGCGIGTKCLMAEARDIRAYGVENKPEYIAEARRLGVSVYESDVRDFTMYGDFGIVYVNYPLRDPDEEFKLEREIQRQMSPGAVLITVNNVRAVPVKAQGWHVIASPVWPDNPMNIRWDWVAIKLDREVGYDSSQG